MKNLGVKHSLCLLLLSNFFLATLAQEPSTRRIDTSGKGVSQVADNAKEKVKTQLGNITSSAKQATQGLIAPQKKIA